MQFSVSMFMNVFKFPFIIAPFWQAFFNSEIWEERLQQSVEYTITGGAPLSLKPTSLLRKAEMINAHGEACRAQDPWQRSRILSLNPRQFTCWNMLWHFREPVSVKCMNSVWFYELGVTPASKNLLSAGKAHHTFVEEQSELLMWNCSPQVGVCEFFGRGPPLKESSSLWITCMQFSHCPAAFVVAAVGRVPQGISSWAGCPAASQGRGFSPLL